MDLMVDVYAVAETFPGRERYVLTQQICGAALSVPSNIAEGRGRGTNKEFCQFLRHSRASLYEVETQITAARRLRYIDEAQETDFLNKSARVLRLVNGLIRKYSDPRPAHPRFAD